MADLQGPLPDRPCPSKVLLRLFPLSILGPSVYVPPHFPNEILELPSFHKSILVQLLLVDDFLSSWWSMFILPTILRLSNKLLCSYLSRRSCIHKARFVSLVPTKNEPGEFKKTKPIFGFFLTSPSLSLSDTHTHTPLVRQAMERGTRKSFSLFFFFFWLHFE